MNEQNQKVIQSMLDYYRNKCNKLEYDFLLYKTYTEFRLRQLEEQRNNRQDVEDTTNNI